MSAQACEHLFCAAFSCPPPAPLLSSPPPTMRGPPLSLLSSVTPFLSANATRPPSFTSDMLPLTPRLLFLPWSPPKCGIVGLKVKERLNSVKRVEAQLNVPHCRGCYVTPVAPPTVWWVHFLDFYPARSVSRMRCGPILCRFRPFSTRARLSEHVTRNVRN